jgi:peptide/nickel transport system substrate-binding protein
MDMKLLLDKKVPLRSLCLWWIVLGFGLLGTAWSQPAEYGQAPQLEQQVAAGELPPIEERLPTNPVVVPVVEEIGTYGGTWRTVLLGASDANHLRRTIGYEGLLRWTPDWTDIVPNVAESFEVNEDATEYTFHLREGLKWSDGHPFTADDIVFWYEDIIMNQELTPAVPTWFTTGSGDESAPGVVEKIDDHTVVFRFEEPYGLFLLEMAGGFGTWPVSFPRHYLEQFHIDYNPEGIDALIQEAGVNTWVDLMQIRGNSPDYTVEHWRDPNRPTLNGWVITSGYGDSTRVTAQRNPYYWKVDPEGNQLPYIDAVIYDIVEDREVILLKVMGGEVDFLDRHIGDPSYRAVLFDNMETGNYRFFEGPSAFMNTLVIPFNMTHQDPVKREIFNNKEFRIGLSHAIDRQEIIDLVFVGQGEPWQVAPQRDTPYFHERLATQYLEYDVDLANEHLDRAGYTERDSEGFRLGPDGNRITLVAEAAVGSQSHVDILEIVQEHWREVGIDLQIRAIDRSLLWQHIEANEVDISVWDGDGGGLEALIRPRYYFPSELASAQAPAWGAWYVNPELAVAEEPEAPERQQMQLYEQLRSAGDLDRQAELMLEILEIAADRFTSIGISTRPTAVGIANNNLRNVPDVIPQTGGFYPNPAPANPVQFFFEAQP